MRCDTEKEVHHVCFVTYQAKRTWATSFQAPEMGTDGQVSTRAHLLGSTWVEGTGSIRARWQAANTVLSMWARKQTKRPLLTLEEAGGAPCLQRPGGPRRRAGLGAEADCGLVPLDKAHAS